MRMPDLVHLQSRVINEPLMLEPTYAKTVISALQGKFNIKGLHEAYGHSMSAEELELEANSWRENNPKVNEKPYQVKGSTAIIPVVGSLVAKTGYLRPYSGMTGYDGIKGNLDIALEDDSVETILFEMNSGGGEVSGCFELADYIYSKRGNKKMVALVNDRACSACYALASACDEIKVSETSTIGSIGVIVAHSSYEAYLEQSGIEVTLITAGKHKADMNPYENLSDEVFGRVKEKIDTIYDMFAERVSKYRNMSIEDVKGTEALTYMGNSAIKIKLADEVISVIDYLESLSLIDSGSEEITTLESPEMAENNTEVEKVDAAAITAEASTGERGRIKSILTHEEADGRKAQAEHLAFNTEMSADDAVALLKVSAKESKQDTVEVTEEAPAQAEGSDFAAAMTDASAEEVGTDDGEEITPESNPAAFAMQSFNQLN